MLTVIKLVNVHYRDKKHCLKKVTFKTVIDSTSEFDKRYYVIVDEGEREVTKDEGNAEYKYLREKHPEARVLILIDAKNEVITYTRVVDHFEVYLGYDFICTCDNLKEVEEVRAKLKKTLY